MPGVTSNPNSFPAFTFDRNPSGEIKIENGQTQVVLETNNKKYRVTVKGSDTLLKDETAVKEIAVQLLLLANVYDLGGKTQALTLKNPTDLGKTMVEQTRTQAKEGKNTRVTTHEGNNLIDILQKREAKLVQKNNQKVQDPAASKSSKPELQNKLNNVRDALRTLNAPQDDFFDDDFDDNLFGDPIDFPSNRRDSDETSATRESLDHEAEGNEGIGGSEEDEEEFLLSRSDRRSDQTETTNSTEISHAGLSFEGTIVPESIPPSRPPPPPPRLNSASSQKREAESKPKQPAIPQTGDQQATSKPSDRASLLEQIRQGKTLKKREKADLERDEEEKKADKNDLTQALMSTDLLARELAKRRQATRDIEEEDNDDDWGLNS